MFTPKRIFFNIYTMFKSVDEEGMEPTLFFLQLSDELPSFYVDLAILFKKRGCTLVACPWPIFLEFTRKKIRKQHLMVMTYNRESYESFKKEIPLKILTTLMANQRLNLYHASSFFENPLSPSVIHSSSYVYFPLPCLLQKMVSYTVGGIYDARRAEILHLAHQA